MCKQEWWEWSRWPVKCTKKKRTCRHICREELERANAHQRPHGHSGHHFRWLITSSVPSQQEWAADFAKPSCFQTCSLKVAPPPPRPRLSLAEQQNLPVGLDGTSRVQVSIRGPVCGLSRGNNGTLFFHLFYVQANAGNTRRWQKSSQWDLLIQLLVLFFYHKHKDVLHVVLVPWQVFA